MAVWRSGGKPFEPRELAFLEGLSQQAVIALNNARLFDQTQAALQRQTASADILRVISQSPNDVMPVVEVIVSTARRLLGCYRTAFLRREGGFLFAMRTATAGGVATAMFERIALDPAQNFPSRALVSRALLHIPDWLAVELPEHEQTIHRQTGCRSSLMLPLLRGPDPDGLGVLIFQRDQPEPFSDADVALAQSFADQAVIAIENVRLFNETREALERQTATAAILAAIAKARGDVQPVLEAIVYSARELARGQTATLWQIEDGQGTLLAHTRTDSDDALVAHGHMEVREAYLASPAITLRPLVVPDTEAAPLLDEAWRDIARVRGYRSIVVVPMLRDGSCVGLVSVTRQQPGPFPERIVEQLQTFADQAVIAIQNAHLFNETNEALERQTATAAILKVISESPTDIQPVFRAIVDAALRLFDVAMAVVMRREGNGYRLMSLAKKGQPAGEPSAAVVPLDAEANFPSRVMLGKSMLHLPDWSAIELPPHEQRIYDQGGYRASLMLPIMRGDECVGTIGVVRETAGAFSDKEVALMQSFVDQAVIAIENVRLFNETKEALEQQTATADILKVISGSVTNTQPVFDAIVQSCRRLFDGKAVALALPRGSMIESVAFASDGKARRDGGLLEPWPLDLGSGAGTCILESRLVAVADTDKAVDRFPRMPQLAIALGYHSALFVPLLRDSKAIGCLAILRAAAGDFGAQEIALAQTFADQAVIAIENARLFNETKEALERQTATSEILRIISESPSDVQPVFDAVAERARLLCKADGGRVWLVQGTHLRGMTAYGPGFGDDQSDALLPLRSTSVAGRCVLERRAIHLPDLVPLIDTEYPDVRAMQQKYQQHAMLAVPLLRDGEAVGVISLLRREARAFTVAEIDLLETFADQAVIAIENVRLFKQTQEALARQTATSEVLQVISQSPTDVQPVFEIIAERAASLTAARFCLVTRLEGELVQLVSLHGVNEAGAAALRAAWPQPLQTSTSIAARAMRSRDVVNVADLLALSDAEYAPAMKRACELAGFRSGLSVPMLRDQQVIGAITVNRAETGQYDAKEIALLQTFARQAVVAIENVRLFNETTDALEQQTATAEVLRVISSSVADTAPVFDKILESGQHLFATEQMGIFLVGDDGQVHATAWRGSALDGISRTFPKPLDQTITEQVIRERRTIHLPDAAAMAQPPAAVRGVVELTGNCSVAWAPMLWEDRGVGSICVMRQPPKPFSDKEIALLKTFADQAVIAIQNARLFNETKEALEQQTATAEVLQVISSSVADTRPVFEAILDSCERLFGTAHLGIVVARDDGMVHAAAVRGPIVSVMTRTLPLPADQSTTGRVIRERQIKQIADVAADVELATSPTVAAGRWAPWRRSATFPPPGRR